MEITCRAFSPLQPEQKRGEYMAQLEAQKKGYRRQAAGPANRTIDAGFQDTPAEATYSEAVVRDPSDSVLFDDAEQLR